MPDFSKYTKEQAVAQAADLTITIEQREKYSSKKKGAFVEQSVKKGEIYNRNDVVYLYYSLGSELIIPSFVGSSETALREWMNPLNEQDAGLTVSVTYTKSSQSKGTILYQDKSATAISVGTSIAITVSSGSVTFMPQFTSSTHSSYDAVILREEAIKICEAAKIVPVFVEESNSSVLEGEIFSQSIAAGTEVAEGSKVTLKYRPVSSTVSVPNFVGMTVDSVKSSGYASSLTIVISDSTDGTATIAAQSIKANSVAAKGSTINLTVGAPAMTGDEEKSSE